MRYVLAALLAVSSLQAQTAPSRPHVLGLAHVAFRVSDITRSAQFYENVLGFQEPFSLKDDNGRPAIDFFKVNDEQYIELFPGDSRSQGQLDHFAFYTDNIQAMWSFLVARGVPIGEEIHKGRVGNSFLAIKDPDGHPIEILQYSSNSMTSQNRGRFLAAGRVSSRITHVGILVSSVGSAMTFYRDVLGFREFYRAAGPNGQPGWVDLQAPDGSDYIELMPFSGVPSPADLRSQNHVSLLSPDVQQTVSSLRSRRDMGSLSLPLAIQTGGNLPPRVNVFDLDGARIEIMESMLPASTPAIPNP